MATADAQPDFSVVTSQPELATTTGVDPEELPELIVPFKKRVYRTVVEGFREII